MFWSQVWEDTINLKQQSMMREDGIQHFLILIYFQFKCPNNIFYSTWLSWLSLCSLFKFSAILRKKVIYRILSKVLHQTTSRQKILFNVLYRLARTVWFSFFFFLFLMFIFTLKNWQQVPSKPIELECIYILFYSLSRYLYK